MTLNKLVPYVIFAGLCGILYWLATINAGKEVRMRFTDAEVQNIYTKVCKTSGQCNIIPGLTIVDDPQVNAYTTLSGIVVYKGLINNAHSEDEIALVVGHEMSHFLLGHLLVAEQTPSVQIWATRVQEMQADKYGAFLMMRAGYNVCKGRQMFKTFKDLYGDVQDADHPSDAFRYDQVDINCS